jgi:hypothetical protein
MSSEAFDPLLPGSFGNVSVERRRSHRETVVAIGKLIPLDASDGNRCIQVLVTELSLHGCDFRCVTSPREGALYRIEMTLGPLSLNSRLRVIRNHVRNSDGTHEIGAEFV